MNKYRVDIKAQKYISGDFCEEIYSDEEYDFSLEFYDEMSASNFIDEEEYYFDMNNGGHRYIICGKSNPIRINQETEEESLKELLIQSKELLFKIKNKELLLENTNEINKSLELIDIMLSKRQ